MNKEYKAKCRNVEDVRTQLIRELNETQFLIKLWGDVQIIFDEDDGTVSQKNFKNAIWDPSTNSKGEDRPVIRVSGFDPENEAEEEGVIPAYYQDEDYIALCSLNDIGSAIFTEKINLESYAQRLKKQIEKCEDIYNEFFNDIEKVFEKLKDDCEDLRIENMPSSLEHLLVDVMINKGNLLIPMGTKDYDTFW